MMAIKIGRNWWKDDPLTKKRTKGEKLFIPFLILGFIMVVTAAVVLSTQTNGPSSKPLGQIGPPTLDEILWFGLSSNPSAMIAWSSIGSVAVALITSKILSDTVKYFDYYGVSSQPKVAAYIAIGTGLVVAHLVMVSAQTWQICHHAFTDYHSILRFDLVFGTVEDLVAGVFNISAVLYYTTQVYRLSGRKVWLAAILLGINTGVFVLTFIIAVTGFKAPEPTLTTMDKFIEYNDFRKPIFMAWGTFSLVGDSALCGSLLFYLFKSKDSILHRGKTLYHKFKALVVETMFPPCICIFILVITVNEKTAMIADYRRAIRYLLTPLYYLSVLHSVVARIDIRRHLAECQDEDTNKDSIPLTANEPGEISTIHIDPKRGKDTSIIEARSRGGVAEVEEIPCKRTFGATESISNPEPLHERRLVFADQDRVKTLPRPSRYDTANFTKIEDLPQKGTFGTGEPLEDISPSKPQNPSKPMTKPPKTKLPPSVGTLPQLPGSPDHPFFPGSQRSHHQNQSQNQGQNRERDPKQNLPQKVRQAGEGGGGVEDVGIPTWTDSYYFGPTSSKSSGSDRK